MTAKEDATISGLGELRDRVGKLEQRFEAMNADLAENTDATKRVEASVASVVEFFQNATGAFKVLEGLGKLAKPISYIAAAGVAIMGMWAAFKAGMGAK